MKIHFFRFILFSGLAILTSSLGAQSRELSPTAKISYITANPGNALYSAWGHAAIRVKDPQLGIDDIFNYGTFNFRDPDFYSNFVRGKLNYMLNVETYKDFHYVYTRLQRTVYEQSLNLSPGQKQQMYDFLTQNALPQHKFYLYDPIFDNCATRPRDVFFNMLGDSLIHPGLHEETDITFREILDDYHGHMLWADFGIDLILGTKLDKKTTPYEQMFLPDYLMQELEKTNILRNGQEEPFVLDGRHLLRFNAAKASGETLKPRWLLWGIFGIMLLITILGRRNNTYKKWIDALVFIILGLMGIVMLFMWVGTDHIITKSNLNLLWAVPIHLFVAPLLFKKAPPGWLKRYFIAWGAIALLLLITNPWFIQQFHIAAKALIAIAALRGLNMGFPYK